ncbi:MAG: hypothetical protein V4663_00105 [Bacteroidota bacterium]
MKPRLDLQKSIQKRRLIYKKTPLFFFNFLLNNLLWLFLLVIPILLASNPKNNVPPVIIIILVLFMLFILSGMYFTNTLLLIRSSSLAENRKQMIRLIQEKFPKLLINHTGQNVISCKRNTGLFNWGSQITIIFNDADILINLTTIGRHEIKSPFHALFNYLKMKQLSKKF